MYKNQLQELAQRSCFNLPSYVCVREGPDHAPRFKASVNFNGEIFQGPSYCTTLRQAEHAAAEVALNTLSAKEPSRHLAARVLDETGVYKNLLQETAHRAGLNLPVYTTVRSGPAHLPVYISSVELVGMNFTGEPAKTKKQAEKNAAMAAWSALKQIAKESCSANQREIEVSEEPEQVVVATFLYNLKPKDEKNSVVQRDQQPVRRKIQQPDLKYPNPASKPNCFLPPFRPSKILPQIPLYKQLDTIAQEMSGMGKTPSLHSSIPLAPVQIRSQTPIKSPEAALLLEAHQKDEDEWLGIKDSDSRGRITAEYIQSLNSKHLSSFCLPSNSDLRRAGPSRPSLLPPIGVQVPKLPVIPHPRIRPSRPLHSYGIAPPVSIRSVIPVCAAPPVRPQPSPPPPPPPPPQKETPVGQVSRAEEEIIKLNRLQL